MPISKSYLYTVVLCAIYNHKVRQNAFVEKQFRNSSWDTFYTKSLLYFTIEFVSTNTARQTDVLATTELLTSGVLATAMTTAMFWLLEKYTPDCITHENNIHIRCWGRLWSLISSVTSALSCRNNGWMVMILTGRFFYTLLSVHESS